MNIRLKLLGWLFAILLCFTNALKLTASDKPNMVLFFADGMYQEIHNCLDCDGFEPLNDPVPVPVKLKLRGRWELADQHSEVNVTTSNSDSTTITIATSDARNIKFQRRKAS